MNVSGNAERERLIELEGLDWKRLQDSSAFSTILSMARNATGAETALVNLVGQDSHDTIASSNWQGPTCVERQFSFCAVTIGDGVFTEIPDLSTHPRTVNHPAVIGAPHLRFYAGAAITTRRGHKIGALCLLDRTPRKLTAEQAALLKDLAAFAADLFELNRSNSLFANLLRQESDAMIGLYKRALESSGSAVMILSATDSNRTIVYVNPAFEALSGYTAAEVLGRDSRFLYGSDPDQAARTEFHNAFMEGREGRAVLRTFRKDQSEIWMDVRISPVRDHTGLVSHYVGFQIDVTDRIRFERELAHMATHDSLTGLPNRTLMYDRLEQAISRHHRSNEPFAVAFVDLDRFKIVNDSLGHSAGDQLLCTVSQRLTSLIGDSGTVARMGGDEFVLILTDYGSEVALWNLFDDIQKALRKPHDIGGSRLVVEASIGVSSCPEHGCGAEDLLRNADTAMYHAKSKGRANTQYYQSAMTVIASTKLNLQSELQLAVERNEFTVHYQPQFFRDGTLGGFEALVRWNHPVRGILYPGAFIDAAEEFGLIDAIGHWVLNEACRQNKAWQDAGAFYVPVGVNVSVSQLRRANFFAEVEQALSIHGLPARYLDLEITETMVMEGPERIVDLLSRLRQLGTKTSIDDFGTGYSSLSFIRRFALDALKIDRSFVNDITTDPSAAAICDTIIRMAHNLGLRVVAEGVETQQQAQFLSDNYCDVMQGFFFSKGKAPAELVPPLMASWA